MKILCIGNHTADTDYQCRQIAINLDTPFNGMLANISEIHNGCYHISYADMSMNQIKVVIRQFDRVIILQQDDPELQFIKNMLFPNKEKPYMQIKDNGILFVGCSHTYGTGHTSHNTIYPYLFSDEIGFTTPIIIDAKPGAGNARIEKTLTKYNITNKNVIVQFSDIGRVRYYSNGSIVEKFGYNLTKNELAWYTDEQLMFEFTEIVDRTVHLLRSANSKFLITSVSSISSSYDACLLHLAKYKEFVWLPEPLIDTVSDGHLGIESHKFIAAELAYQWRKLYNDRNS